MLLITSSCELKKVAEKIAIMKKEIHLHLDEEVANQIDEMCNHVYKFLLLNLNRLSYILSDPENNTNIMINIMIRP